MRATVRPDGSFHLATETFPAALGRGGIRSDKREGDGATPIGVLPLRRVLYRSDRLAAPACAVPIQPIGPNDGWCDDPADAAYNQPVRLPMHASTETLWRDDSVYDIIGILGWNDDPIVPGRGSAIFLHLARPDYAPTEGCVALASDHLRKALAMGLTEIVVMA